jgi:hypothetical protein
MSVVGISTVASAPSSNDHTSIIEARKALDAQKQRDEEALRQIRSAKVEGEKGYNLDVVA